MRCSTCGTPAAAAEFCTDRCLASYKRALERHPLRQGDLVRVPADAFAASVCALHPALIHEECADAEQVRTADDHYVLPAAVVDRITAWVEHIGNDFNRQAGESEEAFQRRKAAGVTDAQYLEQQARAARKRAAEEGGEVPPGTRRAEEPFMLLALPYTVLVGVLEKMNYTQLVRMSATNTYLHTVIRRNGLLLRFGNPKVMVQTMAETIFTEDLSMFLVCRRYLYELLPPLFLSLVSALHKGCSLRMYGLDEKDFAVYEWVLDVLRALPDTAQRIAETQRRITADPRYVASPAEIPIIISYGLPSSYVEAARAEEKAYAHWNTLGETEGYYPFHEEITDDDLLEAATNAYFRLRFYRATQWLYDVASGPHLNFEETCTYTLRNMFAAKIHISGANLFRGGRSLYYFVPADVVLMLRDWRTRARRSGISLRGRGFNLAGLGVVQHHMSPCAWDVVHGFCDVGYLNQVCEAIVQRVYMPIASEWIHSAAAWIGQQPDNKQLLHDVLGRLLAPTSDGRTRAQRATLAEFASVFSSLHALATVPRTAGPGRRSLDVYNDELRNVLMNPERGADEIWDLPTWPAYFEHRAQALCDEAELLSVCADALEAALITMRTTVITDDLIVVRGFRAPAAALGLAVRSLMERLSFAQLMQMFGSGVTHMFHIVQLLSDDIYNIILPRRTALMLAYRLYDMHLLAGDIGLEGFSPQQGHGLQVQPSLMPARPRPGASLVVGPAIRGACDTLYTLAHGGETAACAIFSAVSYLWLKPERGDVRPLANFLPLIRSLVPLARGMFQRPDIHYEMVLFARRLLTLDMLVRFYGEGGLGFTTAFLAAVLQALRSAALGSSHKALFDQWVELETRAHQYSATSLAMQTALDVVFELPGAGGEHTEVAASQLRGGIRQQRDLFLTDYSNALLRFLESLPRPAYYATEPLYEKPPEQPAITETAVTPAAGFAPPYAPGSAPSLSAAASAVIDQPE